MRQEVVDRIEMLRMERLGTSWTDGWLYGRLTEEFQLNSDELEFLAELLGFKYGWNPKLKAALEAQWQQQGPIWKGIQRTVAEVNAGFPTVSMDLGSAPPLIPQVLKPTPPHQSLSSSTTPTKDLQTYLDQLHGLVGLDSVKASIQEFVNIAKVAQMRANAGLQSPSITRHLVFTGNPALVQSD